MGILRTYRQPTSLYLFDLKKLFLKMVPLGVGKSSEQELCLLLLSMLNIRECLFIIITAYMLFGVRHSQKNKM